MVELSTCTGVTSNQQNGIHGQYQSSSSTDVAVASAASLSQESEPIINAADINAFLSKLHQQQQQIMALQNDQLSYEVHHQINNFNSHGINLWIDTNENIRNQNQSKLSVNLSALKHDHPLIASAVDNNRTNSGLCPSEGILIASLPPSTPLMVTQTAQWQCDSSLTSEMNNPNNINRNKPICLPYGYYYDDSKVQGQTHFVPNVPTDFEASALTNCNYEDLMFDDGICSVNNYNECIYDIHHYCSSPYSTDSNVNIESVFQVDSADLKSGPTLAQLNSNLTNDIWDSLDLDDLINSAQHKYKRPPTMHRSMSMPLNDIRCLPSNSGISYPMELEYDSKLQENIDYLTSLLFNSRNINANVGTNCSVPCAQSSDESQTNPQPQITVTPTPSAQSSSLTPNQANPECTPPSQIITVITNEQPNIMLNNLLTVQTKKQQIQTDVKTESHSSPTGVTQNAAQSVETKILNRVRNNSMSTEYSASSHDEGFASQPEDSDDEDIDSDDESFYGDYEAADLLGASTSDDANNKWSLNMGRSRKGGERRYFWQYNVQSKGPKGTRIAAVDDNVDPHILREVSDPVFSPDCQIEGVKHSGKARRGDGNDLTPNPKKLLMIGLELKKLSKTINDLTPVAEVPLTARSKSRKEKNKLASRACRLKKKAQHEANKLKLFGLQQEHKKMILLINEVKKFLKKTHDGTRHEGSVSMEIEQLVKQNGASFSVAGCAGEFVNSILDNVAEGMPNGGLDKI